MYGEKRHLLSKQKIQLFVPNKCYKINRLNFRLSLVPIDVYGLSKQHFTSHDLILKIYMYWTCLFHFDTANRCEVF